MSIFGVEVDASASVADAVFFWWRSSRITPGGDFVSCYLIAQLGPWFVARGGAQIIYLATLHRVIV